MQYALWLVILAATPDGSWKEVSDEGTQKLWSRDVAGCAHKEFRVTSHSAAKAEALCNAAFADSTSGGSSKLVERKEISASAQERVVYERIRPPLGGDRDYFVQYRMDKAPDGSCAVKLQAVGGAEHKGVQRLSKLKGEWRFRPTADGGTDISYEIWTDPEAGYPVFLVEPVRKKSALELVTRIKGTAEKTNR